MFIAAATHIPTDNSIIYLLSDGNFIKYLIEKDECVHLVGRSPVAFTATAGSAANATLGTILAASGVIAGINQNSGEYEN